MKKLYFNQNKFLHKNNFKYLLKCEISKMFNKYLKDDITVPTDFETFDKEISDLIIKILETKNTKNKKRKIKCTNIHYWKFKKFIK